MTLENLKEQAIEQLEQNDDLLVDMVDEVDSWNGWADGFRGYSMYELDELFAGVSVSEFLDKLAPGFNHNDTYFIDTIWGIDSTDDLAAYYRDNIYTSDLLEQIIDNFNHIYFNDDDFEELISAIVNFEEEEEEEAA
jgi:hypothetical protein